MFCSDASKHNDELLKHQHGLRSHPEHSGQCEVMDKQRHNGTQTCMFSSLNAHQEEEEHAEDCYTELGMEFAGISLPEFPTIKKRLSIQVLLGNNYVTPDERLIFTLAIFSRCYRRHL